MRRVVPRWLVGALGLAATVATTPRANAFTIESVASEGCHERITSEALRRVRADTEFAPPIEPTQDEQALIQDLQFGPEDDMMDVGAVSLLLGVRDNDLRGRGSDDLTSLAQVHGDPDTQDQHCLRAEDQDEPGGTDAAIDACRAFIQERVSSALDGLSSDGLPLSGVRAELALHLAIRGDVDAQLPAFYVRMGQALHALEDSFAHSYRTEDAKRITVSLNWLELISEELQEDRDGPPHSGDLDVCDDADELRMLRRETATDAAEALLRAVLGPGSRSDKLAATAAVLDEYLAYEPGCTFDNMWCNAPEAQYNQSACSCRTVGDHNPVGAWAVLTLGLVVGLRRRALWIRAGRRRAAQLAVGAACVGWSTVGHAQEAEPSAPLPAEVPPPPSVPSEGTEEEGPPPPKTVFPVEEPGPAKPNAVAFGGNVSVAGAVDKPGFAGSVGGRLRLHKNWALGLDAEWNPFISVTGGEPVRSGTVNIYASGLLRFPLAYESINLRSQLSLGSSTLVTDLYGAPAGTTGLFVGANFLGLEYKASSIFYVIINPLGIAIPIPQLQGVPFLYPQYRLSLGLEFYAGG